MRPNPECYLAEARRRTADTPRVEATLRADAAWQRVYSETFSRTLTELLAGQQAPGAAT